MDGELIAYYTAVASSSFAVVIFGAALVGSRLVSLAERAATLDRERGDFLNQRVTAESPMKAGWGERHRRNALADLHVLVRRVRNATVPPIALALAIGVGSLGPLLGWPADSVGYRVTLLIGLVLAIIMWAWIVVRLADDVLLFTRAAHRKRAVERERASQESGGSYLISGDPNDLAGAFERLTEAIGTKPEWTRHPIRRARWWNLNRRLKRKLGRERPGV